MQVNLIGTLFIMESEKNDNIRKNALEKIKVLVKENNALPSTLFQGKDIKKQIRSYISQIIGSDMFHLEQVITLDSNGSLDVIFLAVTNNENVKSLPKDYKLVDFKVENNNTIYFGDKTYKYKTKEIIENNTIDYVHEVTADDDMRQILLYLLMGYKRIRVNVDNTDIIFKFMPKSFTLEDVRILYQLITEKDVDKSNFRKKIVKYCEKIEDKETEKIAYRPSQKYRFKPLKGDVWL